MLKLMAMLAVTLFTFNLHAAERVVLLAPAAADIMLKLGCESRIVGKTKSVEEFEHALKVGSHIKPNVELIVSLNPDMIIVSSNRFFTEEMAAKVKVPVIKYNPVTLSEILDDIRRLGKLMGKAAKAEELNKKLIRQMNELHLPANKPGVLFEVMQIPFTLAGEESIVTDIVKHAGGRNLLTEKRKLVRFSIEKAVSMNPDYYIYQVGPMNKAPTPPEKRPHFQAINPEYLQVDEKLFSRANSNSFKNVLMLNKLFNKER